MEKRKSKFKILGFSGLAMLMACTGVLSFGVNTIGRAQEQPITKPAGLIIPKADDPVIYTTESGLNIKWGNDLPNTYSSSLGSGNLMGFPYFTTTTGSTTYTWVIIGANEDVKKSLFYDFTANLYSKWKTNFNTVSGTFANYYFSNNDSSSPCGALIENTISSKTFIVDKVWNSLIKSSSEIPSSCALVLSNDVLGTGTYNNGVEVVHGNEYYAVYYGNVNIAVTMNGYYTNKSFGLSSIYSQIQQSSICTKYARCYIPEFQYSENNTTTPKYYNHYFFPLAAHSDSSFYYGDYLTLSQMSCTSAQFLRGNHVATYEKMGYPNGYTTILAENATSLSESRVKSTSGYRPAFVMKVM